MDTALLVFIICLSALAFGLLSFMTGKSDRRQLTPYIWVGVSTGGQSGS